MSVLDFGWIAEPVINIWHLKVSTYIIGHLSHLFFLLIQGEQMLKNIQAWVEAN